MLLTVVLSKDLVAPSFAQSQSGTVERNLTKKLFVTVPEGAKALQVNLSGGPADSQVRWIAYNPYGVPVESTSSLACFTNFSAPSCNSTSRSLRQPAAGRLGDPGRGTPHLAPPGQPLTLKAAAQGVTVDPATQTVASATRGRPRPCRGP